tara:strand:- start:71 stop:301 length:231 start_codon:yes stop_codon:yes gene_type:complete
MMQKTHFYKSKFINENKDKRVSTPESKIDTKSVVDINILLNKVKIEKKRETKKKIIFFSFVTLALSVFGTFIAIIK